MFDSRVLYSFSKIQNLEKKRPFFPLFARCCLKMQLQIRAKYIPWIENPAFPASFFFQITRIYARGRGLRVL